MKGPFPTRIFLLGLGLLVFTWWLWAWPYDHLRFYEANTASIWALGMITPPLLGWLAWYGTRAGRTRSDLWGAFSFVLIGGYVFVHFALAGALHLINAAVGGAVPLVRGTVVARHLPRPHKRRSRALFPHIITVQLVGLPEPVKLAVPNRPDINRYPTGSAFAEPLRRGALGWWFAPKP